MLGRSGSGKTTKIRELIKQKIINDQKIILLVPEQNSFENEYSLLKMLGEVEFKKVKVLTFKRLPEFIKTYLGTNITDTLGSGERCILISEAIKNTTKNNKLINANLESTEALVLICDILKKYKEQDIKYNHIKNSILKIDNKILKNKLIDSLNISKEYEKIIKARFVDSFDELGELYKILKGNNFFKDFCIFIDNFSYFTSSQLNILKLMIKETQVFIVLKCNPDLVFLSSKDIDLNWQFIVKKTFNKIINIAKNLGFKKPNIKKKINLNTDYKNFEIKKEINVFYFYDTYRFKSTELKILEKNLFEENINLEFFETTSNFNNQNIVIYKAQNISDECEFVARNIKRLVMYENYNYSDFVIIVRNINEYKNLLKTTLDNYCINFFLDYPDSLINKNIMILVLSSLEVINSNFKSEYIFKYLKSGLTGFNIEDISMLENYCLFWNINNDTWLTDFTFFSKKSSDNDFYNLNSINEIRKKIITPFLNFKNKLNNNKYILSSFYEFLIEIELSKNIKNSCFLFESEGKTDLCEEQSRLWDILINFLEKIDNLFLGKNISLNSFIKYLNILIKNEDISFIPFCDDEVVITSVDRMRIENKKVTFIVGASKGNFPAINNPNEIFNNFEKRNLASIGIDLGDSIEEIWTKELFFIYCALSISSEKLFVSWQNISKDTNSQSEIISEIIKIFPKININSKFSINFEDLLWSKKNSFNLLAKKINKIQDISEFDLKILKYLKKFFENDEEFKEKLNLISIANNKENLKFNNSKILNEFLNNKILISASQIEKFYSCEFSYFFNYILKIKKNETIKFSAAEHGSMIHFIIEKFFLKYDLKSKNFNEDEIFININNSINEYLNFFLGNFKKQNSRFKYLILRQANFAKFLINNMLKSINTSIFSPIYHEFKFTDKNIFLKIDDFKVLISGKIDRIDISNQENQNLFRIIDYKTGSKKFELIDILYGLNIQMALYLKVFNQNKFFLPFQNQEKISPVGFFYYPAIKPVIDFNQNLNLENEINKNLKMYGLILDEQNILDDIKNELQGQKTKSGKFLGKSELINKSELDTIFEYVNTLIKNMITRIKSGKFNAKPICKNNEKYCKYCEYKMLCRQNTNKRNIRKNLTKEEIFKLMESRNINEFFTDLEEID